MKAVLPFPPKELSPNGRHHWASKARAVKQYRATCGWIFRTSRNGTEGLTKATVTVRFYTPDARRYDQDNLLARMKPAWDSLQDSGVIVNDRGLTVELVGVECDRKDPRVECWIRPS